MCRPLMEMGSSSSPKSARKTRSLVRTSSTSWLHTCRSWLQCRGRPPLGPPSNVSPVGKSVRRGVGGLTHPSITGIVREKGDRDEYHGMDYRRDHRRLDGEEGNSW